MSAKISTEDLMKGNKLIELFMNPKYTLIGDWFHWNDGNGSQHHVSALMYHTDWNLLMKCIAKIEDGGLYSVSIENTHCSIDDTEGYFKEDSFDYVGMETIVVWGETKIISTYTAVTQFITWYNQQT